MADTRKGDRHKNKLMVVRIEPEVYEAVEADSVAEERTVAQTVRLAVREYLRRKQDGYVVAPSYCVSKAGGTDSDVPYTSEGGTR